MAARVDLGSGPASTAATPPRPSLGLQVAALVVASVVTLGALAGISALVARPPAAPGPSPAAPSFLVSEVRPAPPLALTGSDGAPFSLESLRGRGALVFFGYTHCPDVCPATIGIVGQVIDQVGPSVRAVFVSVDPERDTVPWLADYLRYLPSGFAAVTGSTTEVRTVADTWGVRYAKVEGEDPERYSMTHTASVYLVDQQGLLRAVFPFGVQPAEMLEVVSGVLATPAETVYPPKPGFTLLPTDAPATPVTSAAPSVGPSATPGIVQTAAPSAEVIQVEVVSTSVWAGGASPVILALHDDDGRIADTGAQVRVQLTRPDGAIVGPAVDAVAVKPPGVADVSYVAALNVAEPGWWRLAITLTLEGVTFAGAVTMTVLDPGGTAPLGGPAPAARTPTLSDVGGVAKEITTDAAPDLRLSRTSTVDALAARAPFVLVVDSPRFKTSPACGKALAMARFLQDRWPSVPFIHLEPFEYSLISDTPTLAGTLANPVLVPAADAWGVGASPWGPTSMPWIFVVDGNGVVRAKYQGVIGTADVDVILSLLAAGG